MSESEELLRKRLEELAKAKSKTEWIAAVETARQYRQSLEMVADLSDNGGFATELASMLQLLENGIDASGPVTGTRFRLRGALIQYLQILKPFPYAIWEVADEPDAMRPDEENLVKCPCNMIADTGEEYEARKQDILDLLWMFGQLARKMKSAYLQRITQLIADLNRAVRSAKCIPSEKATALISDFADCWRLVMTEVSLMAADEVVDIWPTRPACESQDKYDMIDTGGMDAETATQASYDRALEIYRRELKDLMLPERKDADPSPEDDEPAMVMLAKSVKSMADDAEWLAGKVKSGTAAGGRKRHDPNYTILERVLRADTVLAYTAYEEPANAADESDEHCLDECVCTIHTREDKLKEQIVQDLDRYLEAACALASKISSDACKDLENCRTLEQQYHGSYHAFWKEDRPATTRDLKLLVGTLKRTWRVLWSDGINYKEPEPVKVVLDGYTEKGKLAAISVTNAGGKDVFSNSYLQELFGVHKNTISNWLNHRTEAPKGFWNAYETRNYDAMRECAEADKKRRSKSDVLNRKDLVYINNM